MPLPPPLDPTIAAEFQRRRRQRIGLSLLAFGLLVLGIALMAVFVRDPNSWVRALWLVVAVSPAMALTAYALLTWACPACQVQLGRDMNPTFCSHCGTRLQ